MQARTKLAAALVLTLAAVPAFASSLGDAGKMLNAATAQTGTGTTTTSPTSALLGTLGSQLKVTPQQATGGTAALLGLAKNKLSGGDYSQLTSSVPGLDQLSGSNAMSMLGGLGGASSKLGGLGGGLGGSQAGGGNLSSMLGNVGSMGDVSKVFGSLGMNSGMASQFAPVILNYLGQQGTSSTLLGKLGSLWGTPAAK
ncbi:MAG: DUF2780 domain-containing protein [Solimonas sp.]